RAPADASTTPAPACANFASWAASLALATLRSFWYCVGSMRNSNSPFLTRRLGSTGTSITRPRTCGITCTTYLRTRTSAEDGATTLSARIMADSATTGMMTTVTFQGVVQGSHLNLMKTSQTKNE